MKNKLLMQTMCTSSNPLSANAQTYGIYLSIYPLLFIES